MEWIGQNRSTMAFPVGMDLEAGTSQPNLDDSYGTIAGPPKLGDALIIVSDSELLNSSPLNVNIDNKRVTPINLPINTGVYGLYEGGLSPQ
jgi:hypothetical protein